MEVFAETVTHTMFITVGYMQLIRKEIHIQYISSCYLLVELYCMHAVTQCTYVTGFVKIDPNHTTTEIHFIAEH